jgi:ceramide glucosyltransferase
MTTLLWLCLGLTGVGVGYQLFQLVAALRFFRRARRRWDGRSSFTPAVTVLKPLKGPGIDLYRNLETFCDQDYPDYEIVFGVAQADDPAAAIVRRLQEAHPDRQIVLTVGEATGANAKVANLVNMMRAARHDVLVLSDADIRVRPDYLRTLVRPLADDGVGLSTCLYRGVGDFGLPSVVESLLINVDFIPMAMVGDWVGIRNAYGASIAMKRQALADAGGFERIRDHLADDYQLGNRIHAAGWELAVLPYVVETILDSATLGDVWRHQLRWGRTYRACQPIGWFCSIVTHATLWGVLSVVTAGGAAIGWTALGVVMATRLATLLGIMRLLRETDTPRHFGLVPLKDLAFSAVWIASWLGRSVVWSGQRYRVDPDGLLHPLGPAPQVTGAPQPQAWP